MKPVTAQEFWRQRLVQAHVTGRGLHTAIYDTDPDSWNKIQCETAGILQKHTSPGMRLLDAGCGYGALYNLVPSGVEYVGVDISPDLIEIARLRHPEATFEIGNLESLQFVNSAFDIAVCRSLESMIVNNGLESVWASIEKELLRVSKMLLLIEFEGWVTARIARQ